MRALDGGYFYSFRDDARGLLVVEHGPRGAPPSLEWRRR